MSHGSPAIESFASFGELLKFLRRRERLTQQQLGIAVGYSEGQISRMESNQRVPDAATLRALFVPALHLENEAETVARLLELAETVRKSGTLKIDPSPAEASVKHHNLPAELTSLVGRETDLAEIARLLGLYTTRLLTLTGSGGCGKTRLALRSGANLAENYPHGVWLVELAPLSDPVLVAQSVISTFGLLVDPNRQPVDTLLAFLTERELLLILDNCEHLIDTVAQLVMELLLACPSLTILTTSREPLGVPGEVTFHVPSLGVPSLDWDGAPEAAAAAQLFLERAASIRPGFQLMDEEGPALARICRRLDGIPLAIELAAARAGSLPVSLIADRLEEGFAVLGSGGRRNVPRQATLQATVGWSYNLLSEGEQVLLRRLPLFAGGWLLEQAEVICTCGGVEGEAVLDLLVSLVSKSLVVAERNSGGNIRYHLHEMVRQFARQRLVEAGEEETLQRCFLDYFIRFAELAEPKLKGPQQMAWLDGLDQERDNFYEALSLAISHQDALSAQRLCGAVAFYWIYRDRGDEGHRWLKLALALPAGAENALAGQIVNIPSEILSARARALVAVLWYWLFAGLPAEDELAYECERIYLSLDNPSGVTYARLLLLRPDDLHLRMEQVRASLPGFLSQGDKWSAALVLFRLWEWERTDGNFEAGKNCLEQCVTYLRAAGDRFFLARALMDSVWLAWDRGNIREAYNLSAEVLSELNVVRHPSQIPIALFYLAYYSAALGDFSAVYERYAEGIEFIETTGAYWRLPSYHGTLGGFYFLEGRLAEARDELEYSLAYSENPLTDLDHWQTWQFYGLVMLYENQLERSSAMLESSLELAEREMHHGFLHGPLRALGMLRLAQGDLASAHDLLGRALAEIIHNRTLPDFPENLDCLARLALAEGKPDLAARLLGTSDGLLARMEMVRYPIYQPEHQRCCTDCTAALGETEFMRLYTDGVEQVSGATPIEMVNALLS